MKYGHLAARSCDVLARDALHDGATWTVHSVFARAFNLVRADGVLVGVVAWPAPHGPATLVVDAGDAPDAAFTDRLVPGMAAIVVGSTLTVGGVLSIDLSAATLWEPSARALTVTPAELARRIAIVTSIAVAEAPGGGFVPLLSGLAIPESGDLVVERARQLLGTLLRTIREEDWQTAAGAARDLSGLGPGLTPSGDDALAGLVLGLRAGRGTLPRPLQAAIALAVVGRTTDLAAARVQHAAAGHADEAVHNLLAALVSGPAENLDRATRALLAYGHSSGADTLVGLLAGLTLSMEQRHAAPT